MDSNQLEVNSKEFLRQTSAEFGVKLTSVDNDVLIQSQPYYEYSYISNQILHAIAYKHRMSLKIFRGVCKMIELNEVEIVYWDLINEALDFGQKLNQKYTQQIKGVAFGFKDFIEIDDVDNIAIYKRQLLFVTISAYFTIKLLRQVENVDKISEYIKVENFVKLFNFLEPALMDISRSISIQQLNQCYNGFLHAKQSISEESINYNFIVDQVLEMAPAYQKDDDPAPTNKVKRQKKINQKKATIVKQESAQLDEPIYQVEKQEENPGLMRQSSGGMFLRSSQPIFKLNSFESIPNATSFRYQDMFYNNNSSRFQIQSRKDFK